MRVEHARVDSRRVMSGMFREGSPELGWIRRMSLRVQQGVRNGVCYGWNLEKEMATHSSILAWKIPWTEEPGRL